MPVLNKKSLLFFSITFILTTLGILEIASVSPHAVDRQLSFAILGVILFILFQYIPLKLLKTFSPLLYALGLVALLLVLFVGRGPAKRWISVGGIYVQPSEAMKLITIVFFPSLFESGRTKRSIFFKVGVLAIVPLLLVLVEPDLGTSAFFLFLWILLSFINNTPPTLLLYVLVPIISLITSFSKLVFGIFLAGLVAVERVAKLKALQFIVLFVIALTVGFSTPLIWQKGLKSYQRKRIVAFLNTRKDLTGAAWQTYQAKVALGSGGLWGRGYKKGTQIRFSFLPAAHTDFIFSSLGEEFGFLGTLTVLLLLLFLIDTIQRQSRKSSDPYIKVLGFGVSGYFLYHALLNMASNVGFFPVVGIPLPFLTAGGSHLLVDFALLGIWSRAQWEERIEGLRFKEIGTA